MTVTFEGERESVQLRIGKFLLQSGLIPAWDYGMGFRDMEELARCDRNEMGILLPYCDNRSLWTRITDYLSLSSRPPHEWIGVIDFSNEGKWGFELYGGEDNMPKAKEIVERISKWFHVDVAIFIRRHEKQAELMIPLSGS